MDGPEPPNELLVDRPDTGIVVLTINRPQARNTISFALWEQFAAALDAIERDTPPRALIIRGAGGHFGNGGDVKTPPARGNGAVALAARLEMGQRIMRRLRDLPVPVIAAIDGGAWGISWSLALSCDMIFAAQDATFGAPFLEYGLVPDGGAAWHLARTLGRYKAAELMFSGRGYSAVEVEALGLVSRLTPPGGAFDAALAFARDVGAGNRHAVELTKRLLAVSDGGDLAAAQALELVYCHVCQAGDEVKVAREAFVARSAAARAARAEGNR